MNLVRRAARMMSKVIRGSLFRCDVPAARRSSGLAHANEANESDERIIRFLQRTDGSISSADIYKKNNTFSSHTMEKLM